MHPSRAAVLVVGVNLIAVWIAAAAGGRSIPPPAAVDGTRVSPDQAAERARTTLAAAADRLRRHDARRPDALAVTRDPFSFGDVARRPSRPAPAPWPPADLPGPLPVAAPPSAPGIVLQGVAEYRDADRVTRTAVVTVNGELVLATVGMRLDGRYTVVAITEDSLELDETGGGSHLTLRLKA